MSDVIRELGLRIGSRWVRVYWRVSYRTEFVRNAREKQCEQQS